MFRKTLNAMALAALLAVGAPLAAAADGPKSSGDDNDCHGHMGRHMGMMGPGMMMGYGMPGMMGYGMNPGMMMGRGMMGYGMPGMMGPGMMGPGMMMGYGPGFGMSPGMMPNRGGDDAEKPAYGMGRGMMGPGMMNPGMMGRGGAGMMGGGSFSADNVKAMMERRLEMGGNPNLKLGKVEEKDDAITAEIVTKDGSLVETFVFDRRTGWMRPAR